jgi:signal transduction histidine kinase
MGNEDSDRIFLGIIQNLTEIDIVYKIDEQGRFTFVSDAVRQLGFEPKDLIGKHYSGLIHPDDQENVSRSSVLPHYKGKKTGDKDAPKLFDERRTKTRGTKNLEVRLLSRDNQVCVGEVTAFGHYVPNIEDEARKFSGTIGVIRNVTEKKRLEEQLRSVTRISSLRTMAAGIAHSFSNYIQVLSGFLDLMVMSEEIDSNSEYYKTVMGAVESLNGLTEKLTFISRGDVSSKTNVDVYETARKVFDLLKGSKYRSINTINNIPEGKFYAHTNEYDLLEVVFNLTKNSLESIVEKGRQEEDYIKISAEYYTAGENDKIGISSGEYIHICFEDTGKGIPSKIKKRIFDPWFTTKTEKKGHGIGLATVYDIVTKENQGYIFVDSEEGKGTIFHIYLPKGSKE